MNKYRSFLIEFYEKSKFNMLAASWVNFLGSPVYYILCGILLPQSFESLKVRLFSSAISVPLLITPLYPKRFKIFLALYWYLWIVIALPVVFTYFLLMNDFSGIWLVAETVMLFIVMLFITDFVMVMVIIFCGIAIGYCLFYFTTGIVIEIDKRILEFMVPVPLAFLCGLLFSYNTKKGETEKNRILLLQEKNSAIKSLAGSIAHEIRNPLNTINLIGAQIDELLIQEEGRESMGKVSYEDHVKNRRELLHLTSRISESIYSANNIINIILNDLKEKKVNIEDLVYLNPIHILPEIKDKYGYRTESERLKVRFDDILQEAIKKRDNKYIFKAVEDRFVFIIFNLLKNALFYLNEYPDSVVTIGVGRKKSEGKFYNTIYVKDTGPGIPKETLPKLFQDFYTSGKKDGTGLGLAFCKRNMLAFGGDIVCESVVGKWTKFSLLLPKISDEELKVAGEAEKRKKILIVDDQKTNLVITKSKIEKNLDFACDMAENGSDAISMIKANKYQLVLMDIQMPEMNGVDAANKIRTINKDVPIVGLSSLQYEDIQDRIESFNYYLNKPVAGHILHRTIAKLIMHEDDGAYLGERLQYLPELVGRRVLLADDQEINRKIVTRKLETIGVKVTEVSNGKQLVDKYKKSLKKDKTSKFDIILTDINMPPFNGDDAAKAIRAVEAKNKVKYINKIPIIALTGNGQKEDIDHFFECGMTDYYIKGQDPELLTKLIVIYITPDKIFYNKKQEDNIKVKENGSDSKTEKKEISDKILNIDKLRYFNEADKKDFLDTFLKDSEAMLTKIARNLKENNLKELSLSLHAFKGVCGNIGAEELSTHIRKIEEVVNTGKLPSNKNWLNNLQKSYKTLEFEIKKIM